MKPRAGPRTGILDHQIAWTDLSRNPPHQTTSKSADLETKALIAEHAPDPVPNLA